MCVCVCVCVNVSEEPAVFFENVGTDQTASHWTLCVVKWTSALSIEPTWPEVRSSLLPECSDWRNGVRNVTRDKFTCSGQRVLLNRMSELLNLLHSVNAEFWPLSNVTYCRMCGSIDIHSHGLHRICSVLAAWRAVSNWNNVCRGCLKCSWKCCIAVKKKGK
jgi:hypothetical protein